MTLKGFELNYQITGVVELQKILGADWQKPIQRGIWKTIFSLQRESMLRTPVDTGLLKASYKEEVQGLTGEFWNFREYAPVQEARRRFLETAVTITSPKMGNFFESEIEKTLNNFV